MPELRTVTASSMRSRSNSAAIETEMADLTEQRENLEPGPETAGDRESIGRPPGTVRDGREGPHGHQPRHHRFHDPVARAEGAPGRARVDLRQHRGAHCGRRLLPGSRRNQFRPPLLRRRQSLRASARRIRSSCERNSSLSKARSRRANAPPWRQPTPQQPAAKNERDSKAGKCCPVDCSRSLRQ